MANLIVPFRPSDIPTGLVGYWKFNNSAVDTQGSYDLTGVNTPAYVAEDYWKSGEYSCDLVAATPTYFTRADADPLDLVDAFSIAGWIKADDITSTTIIDKGSGTTGYAVQIDGSSKIVLNMNNGARATSATAISAGKWHHFVCVYDQATARIYLDGNLDNSSAYSTDCQATTTVLHIGIEDDASTAPYDGHIKDLAIWSAALTPIQVKSLALGVDLSKYAYRPNNVSTQPTHWWKLNEVSGNRSATLGSMTLTDGNTVTSSGGYVEGVGATFLAANSEYLYHADDASLDITGSYSMSIWCKPTVVNITQVFISKSDDTNGYQFGLADTGKMFVQHEGTTYTDTGTALVAGTNYHLAVRYDTTANEVYFYLDGVLNSTVSATTDPTGTALEFAIGRRASSDYASATLSDAAIWTSTLITASEIKSLACALPIQRQGIVSYWKMDEASGNAVDSIGSNTGVETSGTIASAAGKVGTARDFEAGDTEYFEVANNDSIDIVSDLCAMWWIKPESVGITHTPMDKDRGGDGYGFLITTGNNVYFYVNNNGSGSTSAVAAGTWAHCVGNYTGAARQVWFNGVKEDDDAYSTNPGDTTEVLDIGSGAGGGNYLDGLLDEMLLAKRYFRPEEIKAVYLKGLNGKEVTSSEQNPSTGGIFMIL